MDNGGGEEKKGGALNVWRTDMVKLTRIFKKFII